MNLYRIYFAALLMSAPPVYSGKYFSNGICKTSMNLHACVQHNSFTYPGKLVLEYINLIQEQDDRRSREPPGVDDRLEEN